MTDPLLIGRLRPAIVAYPPNSETISTACLETGHSQEAAEHGPASDHECNIGVDPLAVTVAEHSIRHDHENEDQIPSQEPHSPTASLPDSFDTFASSISNSSTSSDSSEGSSSVDRPPSVRGTHSLLPLPTCSLGYVTHSHQQAMANRISHDKLLPGGALDPAMYTPVFLHDTLMLPGSLASLLGKDSALDVLDRLTPARLPSFTILPHADTPYVPCLLPAPVASAVTGLLFFGTGRDARKLIKNHYRPFAKRTRANVIIEVKVPVDAERECNGREWRLEPRRVMAQLFVGRVTRRDSKVGRESWDTVSRKREQGLNDMHAVDLENEREGKVEADLESRDQYLDGKDDWSGPPVFGSGRYIDPGTIEW